MPARAFAWHDRVMPKTIDALSSRTYDAIADARGMLAPLRLILPHPDGLGPQTSTIGRSAPESSEPWNTPAADAYWNLWFGPGKLVAIMRYGIGLRRRPDDRLPVGDDAYDALANLVPSAPDESLRYAVRRLEQWATMARQVPAIDEAEPWTPVPARPGLTPPECPYCRTFGLRMKRRGGEVRCFFPGCRDADGLPTRASMEPGRMTGEAHLVFGDGTTLHFRETIDA
jgi:hypothetical protein